MTFASWDQSFVYSSNVVMLKQDKATARYKYPVGISHYVSGFWSLFTQVHA